MELGNSSDDQDDAQELRAAEDIAADQLEAEEDEDRAEEPDEDGDLPPVPGLARPPSPSPPVPADSGPTSSLAFAPRGIGARPGIGRGGIGAAGGARGGLGSAARGGIGSGASALRPGLGAFAAATSASAGEASRGGIGAQPPRPAAATVDSGTASPIDRALTPHAGIGAAGTGRGGIGARPNQSLVDSLRAELAGPAPGSPSETVTESLASSSAGASRTASPAPPPRTAGVAPTGTSDSSTTPREKRSFLPAPPKPPGSAAPKPKLSKSESVHFARLASSGSIGMKMLEKMGWQTGSGLGREGQGIVTPIGEGQKMRGKNEGIRAGERSKGALLEEQRR